MKNKKGFTLVEIIVSLVILSLIGLVIGLNLRGMLKSNEAKAKLDLDRKIVSAAELFVSQNADLVNQLETSRGFVEIYISQLINSGFLDGNLKNPDTGEALSPESKVKASLDSSGTIIYIYPSTGIEEHLQTLNRYINYNANYDCKGDLGDAPGLVIVRANGNYVAKADHGAYNVQCNSSEVNTGKIGNYVQNYSYRTSEGITKTARRNVIVVDNVQPAVPEWPTISTAWRNTDIILRITLVDNESGVGSYALSARANTAAAAICLDYRSSTSAPGNKITVERAIAENGWYRVCVRDQAGNQSDRTFEITNIDKVRPVLSCGTGSCTATDALSGLASSSGLTCSTPSACGGNRNTCTATATDRAGNTISQSYQSAASAACPTTSRPCGRCDGHCNPNPPGAVQNGVNSFCPGSTSWTCSGGGGTCTASSQGAWCSC